MTDPMIAREIAADEAVRRGSYADWRAEFPEYKAHGWTCSCGFWNPPEAKSCMSCDPYGVRAAIAKSNRKLAEALRAIVLAAEAGHIDWRQEIRDLADLLETQ